MTRTLLPVAADDTVSTLLITHIAILTLLEACSITAYDYLKEVGEQGGCLFVLRASTPNLPVTNLRNGYKPSIIPGFILNTI